MPPVHIHSQTNPRRRPTFRPLYSCHPCTYIYRQTLDVGLLFAHYIHATRAHTFTDKPSTYISPTIFMPQVHIHSQKNIDLLITHHNHAISAHTFTENTSTFVSPTIFMPPVHAHSKKTHRRYFHTPYLMSVTYSTHVFR